jgi:aminoglycoside phosphotransferase (APT) family kinase protein
MLEASSEAMPVSGEVVRDEQKLSDWLTAHIPGLAPPLRTHMLSAGRSNIIYELTDANDRRYVLRRPPSGGTTARTHDVMREWKILQALSDTAVPTPGLAAMCESEGIIGAPFLVMHRVVGRPLNFDTARTLSASAQQQLGTSLADVLHTLHSIDLDAIGLGSLRRERGAVDRQVTLWRRRLDGLIDVIDARTHADMTELGAGLVEKQPKNNQTVLLHGDFKADNLMIDDAGQVVAVLDWELTTTGNPLIDLAWLLVWWGDDIYGGPWLSTPINASRQLCSGRSIAQRYLASAGFDASALTFYLAFAYWRLSAINLVTRARFVSGAMAGKSLDLERMDLQLQWQMAASRKHLTTESTY